MAINREEDFHAEGIYFDEKSEQYSRQLKRLNPEDYAPELQEQIAGINEYLDSVADSFEDLQNRIELMEYTNESGIWSMKYDESGRRTDLAWSDGVRHLLGYENEEDFPDEFQSWVNVLAPEMAATAAEVFDSVAAFENSPALTRYDYPMRRKDGEWHWYHSTGKISRRPDGTIKEYIGTYRDITAEHNKDIYISQLKTIGSMFDFMTYINLEDNSFVQFTTNDQIEQHRPELGGNIFETFNQIADLEIAPEFREEAKKFYDPSTLQERLRETGRTSLEIYNDAIDKWFRLVYIGGSKDEEGNYKDVMFVSGDITEDKMKDIHNKAALEKALKEAEAASKAKSTFLFNMSHDIRTPLNAIKGFTELAEQDSENLEKAADYRTKVLTATNQLTDILNNVLEMARIENDKIVIEDELADMNQFIDSCNTVFEGDLKDKNITFEAVRDITHNYIYIDQTHLNEVFMNIMSNAIKYTPAGGRIYASTREFPGSTEDTCIIETRLRDTGIGMSEEFVRNIFDEFSRERNSSQSGIQGTGLGMAIVKRLVELMHGSIEIQSAVGEGTEVIIRIPHRIGEAPQTAEGNDDESTDYDFTGYRVLMAEDMDVNALLANEILTMFGFEVERARDGIECIDMLRNAEAGYYDLILMDIQMPNMNGYQAASQIREMKDPIKANIPIAALSANAFKEDMDKSREAGMDAHLAKPIDINALTRTCTDLLKNS